MSDEKRVAAGKLAAKKLRKVNGKNYFAVIGARGGRAPHNEAYGFTTGSEKAAIAGKKSKRGYTFIKETAQYLYYRHKGTGKVVRVKHATEQS